MKWVFFISKISIPILIGFAFAPFFSMIKQKSKEFYKYRRWTPRTRAYITAMSINLIVIIVFALILDYLKPDNGTYLARLYQLTSVDNHCTWLAFRDYHNWFTRILFSVLNIVGCLVGIGLAPQNFVYDEDTSAKDKALDDLSIPNADRIERHKSLIPILESIQPGLSTNKDFLLYLDTYDRGLECSQRVCDSESKFTVKARTRTMLGNAYHSFQSGREPVIWRQ